MREPWQYAQCYKKNIYSYTLGRGGVTQGDPTAPHASHACPLATTWSIPLRWLLVCLLLPPHPSNNLCSILTHTLATTPYRSSGRVLGFHASDTFPVFVLLSSRGTAPFHCGERGQVAKRSRYVGIQKLTVTMVNTTRRGFELGHLAVVAGSVLAVKMGQYILEQLGKRRLN